MKAKDRWKRAGLIVKTVNRLQRSRKSVVYLQLRPDRSDSDDDEDDGQNRNVDEEADRRARVARQKDDALAEYNKINAWSANCGEGNARRLSVMLNAHGDNETEEETETFMRAKITKEAAARISKMAAEYALALVDEAERGVLKKVFQLAAAAEAIGKAAAIALVAGASAKAMLLPLEAVLAQQLLKMRASGVAAGISWAAAAEANTAIDAMWKSVGREAMIGVAAAVAAGAAYAAKQASMRAQAGVDRWKDYGAELRKMNQALRKGVFSQGGFSSSDDDDDDYEYSNRQRAQNPQGKNDEHS
jgi:hypothetical protein